jgi:hypothetical protein
MLEALGSSPAQKTNNNNKKKKIGEREGKERRKPTASLAVDTAGTKSH